MFLARSTLTYPVGNGTLYIYIWQLYIELSTLIILVLIQPAYATSYVPLVKFFFGAIRVSDINLSLLTVKLPV